MRPPDDGEGDTLLQHDVLALELVVLVRVAIGELVNLNVVLLNLGVDPFLQPFELGNGEAVCLGNDGYQIDLVLKAPEKLEVDLPEAVAVGGHEVEAAVHPRVHDVLAVETTFSLRKAETGKSDVLVDNA